MSSILTARSNRRIRRATPIALLCSLLAACGDRQGPDGLFAEEESARLAQASTGASQPELAQLLSLSTGAGIASDGDPYSDALRCLGALQVTTANLEGWQMAEAEKAAFEQARSSFRARVFQAGRGAGKSQSEINEDLQDPADEELDGQAQLQLLISCLKRYQS